MSYFKYKKNISKIKNNNKINLKKIKGNMAKISFIFFVLLYLTKTIISVPLNQEGEKNKKNWRIIK